MMINAFNKYPSTVELDHQETWKILKEHQKYIFYE